MQQSLPLCARYALSGTQVRFTQLRSSAFSAGKNPRRRTRSDASAVEVLIEVLAQPVLEIGDELAAFRLRLDAAEHRIAIDDDHGRLGIRGFQCAHFETPENTRAAAAQRDVLGTRISTLPNTEVALITVRRCPKSASVRSISTLPNSEKAFVRAPTRQRPLRVELLKIATRFSAGGPVDCSGGP